MPINPSDLQRLAAQIERLQRTSTHGWQGGDELEFRNQLPNSRVEARHKLPDPKILRDPAHQPEITQSDFQTWNQRVLRMDGMIRDNDPRNPRRIIRDMARGKFPLR